MFDKQWIRKRAAAGIRLVRGARGNRPEELSTGVPPGITHELLSDICQREFGDRPVDIVYAHLSGWKESGSYRLYLKTDRGRNWTLIYKNAVYEQDQIPALATLPLKPGAAEYVVYSNPPGSLARYLPHVYYCREVTPNVQYQYLMEDLGEEYRRASEQADRLRIAEEMPSVHQALADWLPTVEPDHLLHYDETYAKRLLPYTYENLSAYAQKTADSSARQLLSQWTMLEEMYNAGLVYAQEARAPIHGDSNPANMLVHRKKNGQIKLIDWEWAGIGLVYADLASLLKRTPSALEQQALELYAQQNRTLTVAEHRRRYEWCQLQRGLLDIGFVAVQQMETSHDTRVNLSKYVTKSIGRVSVAVERLRYEQVEM